MANVIVSPTTPIYHGSPYGGTAPHVTIQETQLTGQGPPELYGPGPYGQAMDINQRLFDLILPR